MIKYSLPEFCDWLLNQTGGTAIVDRLTNENLQDLHIICLNFTDDVIHEQVQLLREIEERRSRERAAAREATARKNTSDAMAAEVEAMRKEIV